MPPVIAALEPDQKSSTQVGNPSLPPSLWCTSMTRLKFAG
jgi:hypothetical protein